MELCYSKAGLIILDIAQPSAPVVTSRIATPSEVQEITVEGDIAYLTADKAGILIVNVSDPSHPAIVGSLDFPDGAQSVSRVRGYTLVAERAGGMAILHTTAE